MAFGTILKSLRNEKDISQEVLATALNLKRSTIAGYETGRKKPDIVGLINIADYFGVSLDYLLGRPHINSTRENSFMELGKNDELTILLNRITENDGLKNLLFAANNLSLEKLKISYEIIKLIDKM